MTSTRYSTHARTMDELRVEFVSDINRRIALVETRIKNSTVARRSATLASIREELENIRDVWTEIELVHDKTRLKEVDESKDPEPVGGIGPREQWTELPNGM